MASESSLLDNEQTQSVESSSASVLEDSTSPATLAFHDDSYSDDLATKENSDAQQDDEEEDDDYDPESALNVPEPYSLYPSKDASKAEPETSKTGSSMAIISDADSESDYEPELPAEIPEGAGKMENTDLNDEEQIKESTQDSKADHMEQGNAQEPVQNTAQTSPTVEQEPETESESDDYDPEQCLASEPAEKESVSTLPPKPAVQQKELPVNAPDLKEAYEAVMQSEVVRSENFVQLSKEKQMEVIQELLREKQIALPGTVPEHNIYSNQTHQDQSFARINAGGDPGRPYLSIPMTEEEERAYEQFLVAESDFFKFGEDLPSESRLFVGNLPSNSIKKEDLFRIFSRYGDLLEITIKAGFGFVQFKTHEACVTCKNSEASIPLHNRLLRLDYSHSRKHTQDGKENGGRGRERPAEDELQESQPKRTKTDVVDVYVLITDQAEEIFLSDFEQALQNENLTHSQKNIGEDDPGEEIREAAYSGVVGVCVIKNEKVDLQIFEETGDGGVKFDEYLDIEPSAACEIVVNAKREQEKKTSELNRSIPSKITDRSSRYKQGHVAFKHKAHQDDKRGNFEKPYSKFNYNERGRGPGKQTWQRNNEFQGRSRSDWDHKPPYPGYPGQGTRNFSENHGSVYNSNSSQIPAYNARQRGGHHFQMQRGYDNQVYGRQPYQNSRGNQGHPRQNFQGQNQDGPRNYNGEMGLNGISSSYSQPSQVTPVSAPAPADPALMQTLQNLDPNTMRSVVAILQQQGGNLGPSPGLPSSNVSPSYHSGQLSNFQQVSPSAQVNSLLAQLQSQPSPMTPPVPTPYSQQPQPHQQYNSAPQQQPQPNEALMNMLSRLGGQ